ncbi:hypothetical protein [Paenibacillus sp. Z6-24]
MLIDPEKWNEFTMKLLHMWIKIPRGIRMLLFPSMVIIAGIICWIKVLT